MGKEGMWDTRCGMGAGGRVGPHLPPTSPELPLKPMPPPLPPDYGDGSVIPDYDNSECPHPRTRGQA